MRTLLVNIFFVTSMHLYAQKNITISYISKNESSDSVRFVSLFNDPEMGGVTFKNNKNNFIFLNKTNLEIKGVTNDLTPLYFSEPNKVGKYIFVEEGNYIIDSLSDKYNKEYKYLESLFIDLYKVYETNDVNKMRAASLENDNILSKYIYNNNESKVAFYLLADRLLNDGKTNEYIGQGLNNFSDNFKKSEKYKYVKMKYDFLSSDNIFQNELKLKDFNLKDITLNIQNTKIEKYLLIDFWYSHCGPCLIQFPKYKKLLEKYSSNNNFKIITISVDQTKYINDWKRIVNDLALNFSNYLDENGLESQKYNINIFPTNFLLDSNGKIIKKNLFFEELEIYMEENIDK